MILEKIKEILETQLDISPDTVTEATNITDDLGADSLDIVELIMSIEEEFQITVSDDEAQNFKTVGDVVSYIEARV